MLLTFTAAQLDEKCRKRANGYRDAIVAASTQANDGYQIDRAVFEGLERQWRPPSLAAKIGNLVQAGADAARSGFEVRNGEQTEAALGICAECEHLVEGNFSCGLCGCNLDYKVKLHAWHCPAGKW